MKNKDQKFFHELTYGERFELYNQRLSWDTTSRKFPRPPWCNDIKSLDGLFGCDDLILGLIKSKHDCDGCKFLDKENNNNE